MFVSFSGKILTDDFADKEGLEMGDEYFANLDHIESVENFKEGYESEAHCSDSEGSGVDMSRVKLPASSQHGKSTTKMEERNSSTTGKSERPMHTSDYSVYSTTTNIHVFGDKKSNDTNQVWRSTVIGCQNYESYYGEGEAQCIWPPKVFSHIDSLQCIKSK